MEDNNLNQSNNSNQSNNVLNQNTYVNNPQNVGVNNLNQNASASYNQTQVNNNPNVNTSINQTMGMYSPNQMYGQYQSSVNGINNNINENQNNNKKNNGPLIIFGVIFLTAIIVIAIVFLKKDKEEPKSETNENLKTLIVYFSKDGENYGKNLHTDDKRDLDEGDIKRLSKKIAGFIDASLYEIEPEKAYPPDLEELETVTRKEKNNDVYPDIKESNIDIDNYDVIFIGYPIWHSSYPQIIKTFVRDNKNTLKNKKIVPFNTHAGSGSAGTFDKLCNLIEVSKDKCLTGLPLNGTEVDSSDEKIKKWLEKDLGYKLK